MSGFTNGPWHIERDGQGWRIRSESRVPIAEIWLVGKPTEANARLIASATELYKALERIVNRKARTILPWTHEAAADEFAAMLDMDRTEAHAALAKVEDKHE